VTGRVRIPDASSDGTGHGHLRPVLEAELAWGNSTRNGFVHTPQDGAWSVRLREPLHNDRLLAEFEFPPHIKVGRNDDGGTYVFDEKNWVHLGAPPPPPERRPRRGLLARILGA